jgi:hypothetical protein
MTGHRSREYEKYHLMRQGSREDMASTVANALESALSHPDLSPPVTFPAKSLQITVESFLQRKILFRRKCLLCISLRFAGVTQKQAEPSWKKKSAPRGLTYGIK